MLTKIFLALFFIVPILHAKLIVLNVTGEYIYGHIKEKHLPSETKFARSLALINAKEKAIEEAGTTMLVSFKSLQDNRGKNIQRSEINAIASGVVTYKVIREGWKANRYEIVIKAKVDTKEAKEILFNTGDNLKIIIDLQKKNQQILKKINQLSISIKEITQKKLHSKNTIEIKRYNKGIRKHRREQSFLEESYYENRVVVRRKFSKGQLLEIADKNDRKFEEFKLLFDQYFVDPFIDRINIRLLNIDVVRHGKFADINFILGMNSKTLGGIESELRKFVDGQQIGDMYTTGPSHNLLLFNSRKGSVEKLKKWIDLNRAMVIRINFGKYSYITEQIAFWKKNAVFPSSRFSEDSRYDGAYSFYNNHNAYYSYRKIKNIPIERLNEMDYMIAEVVYSSRNISDPLDSDDEFEIALPSIREATEFY